MVTLHDHHHSQFCDSLALQSTCPPLPQRRTSKRGEGSQGVRRLFRLIGKIWLKTTFEKYIQLTVNLSKLTCKFVFCKKCPLKLRKSFLKRAVPTDVQNYLCQHLQKACVCPQPAEFVGQFQEFSTDSAFLVDIKLTPSRIRQPHHQYNLREEKVCTYRGKVNIVYCILVKHIKYKITIYSSHLLHLKNAIL